MVVDDDKVLQMMVMGFTDIESRLALRSCVNDLDAAVDQIFKVNNNYFNCIFF